ncbi:hypothetical protein JTB14_028103 [Gonioctena quinquepunctata]|nr:hypothetical protein JTB14_028103 [Gonioctena quinquepunctata]
MKKLVREVQSEIQSKGAQDQQRLVHSSHSSKKFLKDQQSLQQEVILITLIRGRNNSIFQDLSSFAIDFVYVFIQELCARLTEYICRPKCLIDCLGKFYEYELKGRLDTELAENQFGFIAKRLTIYAIKHIITKVREGNHIWEIIMLIDAKNAFNPSISGYLTKAISNYLSKRAL